MDSIQTGSSVENTNVNTCLNANGSKTVGKLSACDKIPTTARLLSAELNYSLEQEIPTYQN